MIRPAVDIAKLVLLSASTIAFADDYSIPDRAIEAVFWGRAIERILLTLLGGGLLYLGFRLFHGGNTDGTGALEATISQHLRLKMQRIAPGTFFALFGTALLVFVASSKSELTTYLSTRANDPTAQQSSEVKTTVKSTLRDSMSIDLGKDPKKKTQTLVASVTTVERYCNEARFPKLNKEQKALLGESIRNLGDLKSPLVDLAFGRGTYAQWELLATIRTTDPAQFSTKLKSLNDAERSKFEDVDRFVSVLLGDLL